MRRLTPFCFAVSALALLAATQPAAARIQCNGNFQMNPSGPIATPYCEEEQIARVAQTYGWKVTADEVHNNPLTKVYVCQNLGGDVRMKGSCGAYSPDNFGPH
ncbi:MAG TPA: hypothetical protein VIG26_09450 [Methyloceanibacter sp.]|jgi:hypothetical protein